MKKLEMNQMLLLEGGKQISCERAAGWIVGVGAVLTFVPGLTPLGITLFAAGAGSATQCKH